MKKTRYLPILTLSITLIALLLSACAAPADVRLARAHLTRSPSLSYRDGNAEVYVIDTSGENLVRLTEDPAYDGVPSWSPDSQSLAFTSERASNADIFVMDADGGNIVQLTDGQGAFNVVPSWSPDGSQILFVSNRTYEVQGDGGHFRGAFESKVVGDAG